MQGKPSFAWKWLPQDLLDDLQDYLTARQFKLRPSFEPWEAGNIPCYWIARCSLFDEVVRRIQKRGKGGDDDDDEDGLDDEAIEDASEDEFE